jgi:hypothetical protein
MKQNATVLFGVLFAIPAIMMTTKMTRMDARDRHEVHMGLRWHASFWEKSNDFIAAMNNKITSELIEAHNEDIRRLQHAAVPTNAEAAPKKKGWW